MLQLVSSEAYSQPPKRSVWSLKQIPSVKFDSLCKSFCVSVKVRPAVSRKPSVTV